MKKQLLSILFIAAAMLMAACGGDNKSGNGEAPAVGEAVAEAEEFTGDTYSKEAVEFFIKNFKLSFSDIEPGYEYDDSDNKNFMGSARDVIANFPTKDGKEMTDDMFKAAVAKVYAATKKAADDGKCIYGFENKSKTDEAMAEISLEECQKGKDSFGMHLNDASWVYKVNGHLQIIYMGTISGTEGCYVRVAEALQKSMDETLEDAEKVIEDIENDPEKKAQVEEALKDAGVN